MAGISFFWKALADCRAGHFLPPSHPQHSVPKASGHDAEAGSQVRGTPSPRGATAGPRLTSGDSEPPLSPWEVGTEVEKSSPQGAPTGILATAVGPSVPGRCVF